jgi:hypothetical protein
MMPISFSHDAQVEIFGSFGLNLDEIMLAKLNGWMAISGYFFENFFYDQMDLLIFSICSQIF